MECVHPVKPSVVLEDRLRKPSSNLSILLRKCFQDNIRVCQRNSASDTSTALHSASDEQKIIDDSRGNKSEIWKSFPRNQKLHDLASTLLSSVSDEKTIVCLHSSIP